jgi:uncharacterized protein YggE
MNEKTIRALVVAVLALFLVAALAAWTRGPSLSTESRRITATGDAEVRVVPDEVILTLGVETWDKNMSVAKSQNDRIVGRVLELANDYAQPEHVKTEFVDIEPRWRHGTYEESDFIGYFVRKTIVITLRDLSKFEDLLARALDAGVNHVHGIQFRTTDLRQHRDEARALAIKAAREKAVALAGELGETVGDPVTINEVHSGWWSPYGSWWGRGSAWMAQNVI